MRTLDLFVASIVLVACGVPADPLPGGPPSGRLAHELTLPARYASSHEVLVYAKLAGGQATEQTELSYGLSDGYPSRVTIAPRQGYVLSNGCKLALGTVAWRSIVEVQGTAARLDLDAGNLAVELREEGTVSALLGGTIEGLQCTAEDGSSVTSFPLQHRLVLQVRRVAGFLVDQFHQQLYGCRDPLVLPAGAPLWSPAAHPLDAAGQRFEAFNAPAPVTITLRSDGGLAIVNDVGHLMAGPGTVSLSVDTALPVRGLRSFEVVGAEAVTSVQASLYLRKAAAKGSVSERIEEGMAYRIFFPEQSNLVDVRVDSATTTQGKLCDNLPGAWFASTSSTPDQCAARGDGNEADVSGFIPVAAIRSPGECRLAVTVPGTSHRWTTKFSTTL